MKSNTFVKYFTSFSASSFPIEPLNEVDLEAAQELATYYEARFNSNGLVVQFIKYLKQRNAPDRIDWQTKFTEEYEYYPTGRLKERRLTVPGNDERIWRFDDKPEIWSKYLDLFASGLFSGRKIVGAESGLVTEEMEIVDRLILCHELMSELDNSVFEAIARQPRTPDWILQSLAEHASRFKEVIQMICPHSNPRVFLGPEFESAGEATSTTKALRDHLELFDAIFGVGALTDLLDPYLDQRIATPQQLPLATTDDTKEWLIANEIASLFVMPIRAKSEQKLEAVALLCLALSKECNQMESSAVASILRRFGQLCQTTIDIALLAEPIEDPESN